MNKRSPRFVKPTRLEIFPVTEGIRPVIVPRFLNVLSEIRVLVGAGTS